MVDALGNPVSFHLTPGQACDLDGSDVLLPDLRADTVLADKGYDVDARVIDVLEAQAYAQRLREAGLSVRATNYNRVTHEFFGAGAVVSKAKQAVSEAAAGLRSGFAGR